MFTYFKKLFKGKDDKVMKELINGEINVDPNSDIVKQLEIINLKEEDLGVIKLLKPFVNERIEGIIDIFYKNLEHEPLLTKIIKDNSSVERLKGTLRRHISEMFDGVIDNDYIEKRMRIAHMHVKIGLGTKWYIGAFQGLLTSHIEIIEEHIVDPEERLKSIYAVSKLFSFEQQLVIEAYDERLVQIQQDYINTQRDLQVTVAESTENLASISEETSASLQDIVGQVSEIVRLANMGAELSNDTEKQAHTGKRQLENQLSNMSNIQKSSTIIAQDVKELYDTSKEMQGVIGLITNVANQTNLLSLNASIEAAHAGESGKGFAVVASEVRKLAEQTSASVTDVSELLNNIEAKIEKLTGTLGEMGTVIHIGNDGIVKTDEQFEEILKFTTETKSQNDNIENELKNFESIINELKEAFGQVANEADRLSNLSIQS